jgi:phenylalanyl-tRNA synthetase beta chain
MKVSVNWLKELVPLELTADEIAHKLTMAGLEVEEQMPVAAAFVNVVVAEVKTVAPHPNADKLRVTEVDIGTGSLVQIVCGAPNVAVGMRVPCAKVGATLPGLTIKQAQLRGVESNGMLCSAKELGLSDEHAGLLALAADAPIGEDIRQYLDLDDVVLTLKITPNRGDCLSMIGIARDLAAITGVPMRSAPIPPVADTGAVQRAVTIAAPAACGHYLGRVITAINAKAATPDWMRRRLERGGFRCISPLVDITNYLTLERGRPMHAFDDAKLNGGIEVRFPRTGEAMSLLNAQHVVLQPDMLLITDAAGPVALGGVMGGLDSSVTDATTSIFLEAAYFDPDVIQGKTRTLGINSDAAFRFERGVDFNSARDGIELATRLAVEICGTPSTQVGPVTEAKGDLPGRPTITLDPARICQLIGIPIETAEMLAILRRLDCKVDVVDGKVRAAAPSYRFDLRIEEDFAEEIARIYGYEKVPATPPQASVPITAISETRRSRHNLRHTAATLGYQEVINYSFVPLEHETLLLGDPAPVRLRNPISEHMSVMRSSLLGGLLQSLQYNLNRGESRLRLFEIGRCFLGPEASIATQPERLAALAYGGRHTEQWGEDKTARADFFSLKGELAQLLTPVVCRFEPVQHPALHPGRAAAIILDSKPIGWIGELHPRWQQHFDLPFAPVAFEVDVAAISQIAAPIYRPISRLPAVRRDVALLVDDGVPIQAMLDAFHALKTPKVVEVGLFDLYRGQTLDAGKKSLAFRIVMQDTESTLTDVECDTVVAKFVEVMSQKFGASLRK